MNAPTISPCFFHPEYDGLSEIPKRNGEICYICYAKKLILDKRVRQNKELEELRTKRREAYKDRPPIIHDAPIIHTTPISEKPKEPVVNNSEARPTACTIHPNYKGLRIAKNGCKSCEELYLYNKKHGIKETRGGR